LFLCLGIGFALAGVRKKLDVHMEDVFTETEVNQMEATNAVWAVARQHGNASARRDESTLPCRISSRLRRVQHWSETCRKWLMALKYA